MGTWKNCEAVERHPEIVIGACVFRGTRVPIATLFENLKDGATLDDFLVWYGLQWCGDVERSQGEAVLQH